MSRALLFLVLTLIATGVYGQTPKTKLVRDADSVTIHGVRLLGPPDAHESSVQASQVAIMDALGENVSYDYLLGVSGLAFRMQLFKDGLCPSSPHPCCGYQCVDRSSGALPWKLQPLSADPKDFAKVKEVRKAVVASIDKGIPVQFGSEEDGVVIGYKKGGDELICLHDFHDSGKKPYTETGWPWGFAIYTERKSEMPDAQKYVTESLMQAGDMWQIPEKNGYFTGKKAWRIYIGRLARLDKADDKTRNDSMQGNAWIYECLTFYRASAAIYLRQNAHLFSPKASAHLLKAADLYEKESKQVLTGGKRTNEIAPYPGKAWTSEQRREEIRRLREASELDEQAIYEIETALRSLCAPVEPPALHTQHRVLLLK